MSKGLFGRLEDELAARDKAAGLTIADILSLPDAERRLVQWILREGEVGLTQAVVHGGQDEAATHGLLHSLAERGFVREIGAQGEPRYTLRVSLRRKRNVPLNLWSALQDKIVDEGETS
jgi:hypothetical protein